MYVPGLSASDKVRDPPWNVGVAPRVGPLVPCCTVRLCPSDASLVNLIVTFPALAVSELLVNRSWPDASAATDSVVAAELLGVWDEAVEVEAGVEAVLFDEDCEALELAWLLLLFEPPQAATRRSPRSRRWGQSVAFS